VKKLSRVSKVLIVLSACVLGVIVLILFRGNEPRVEGRQLSAWIWQMVGAQTVAEREEAHAVVRRLGPDTVPILLDWLRQEDRPSMTARFDAVRQRAFFWTVRQGPITNNSITSLQDFNPSRSAMATWALPQLNNECRQAAIPILVQMLGDRERTGANAVVAFQALSKMAPESVAPLITALSSTDDQVRMWAMCALAEIGPSAKGAIPYCDKGLKDKDPKFRAGTAELIGKLGGEPDSFVPVLVQALPELDPESLDYYLEVLLRHKEHAATAIPVLQQIQKRTEHSTNQTEIFNRGQVTKTLQQIEPASVHDVP
jgi:hypothetical protein